MVYETRNCPLTIVDEGGICVDPIHVPIAAGYGFGGAKGTDPSAAGEEVLYLARLKLLGL